MTKKAENFKGEIIIYPGRSGQKAVDVRLEKETIWLNQAQIALLFGTKRPAITKHLQNIFKEGELNKKLVSSILEHTASDGKIYNTQFYNLDAIISVGYRINSKQATKFRIWATTVLKDHLTKGYTVNRKVIANNYDKFIKTVADIKALLPADKNLDNKSIVELVKIFADTWLSLDAYDKNKLDIKKVTKRKVHITAQELEQVIAEFKSQLIKKKQATDLFARARQSGSLAGIVGNVMQTFGGKDLYPGLEEKAVHLLYFIVKNHPFVDGNKRSGAYGFVWFLRRVGLLNTLKLTPAALTAVTLLIAESKPSDKDKMVKLVVNLLK
jgi:prophage maintenance system killer protein